MQMVFQILNGVLTAYMLLLFIRILLTWFRGPAIGKPYEILVSITDPYLNIFRKIRFLQLGRMDFSPLAAIILLVIVMNIINMIAITGTISLGIILAIILDNLWNTVSYLGIIVIIMCIIRVVTVLLNFNAYSPLIQTIDTIIQPIILWVSRKFFKNRALEYKIGLSIVGAALLAVVILGGYLIAQLSILLQKIPF